jgi:hypothetical protein
MQICPALENLDQRIRRAAVAKSASSKTTAGDFPPSSRVIVVKCSAQARAMIFPTMVDPV